MVCQIVLSIQLNECETIQFFLQSKPKFDWDSLLLYVFCTNCEPEIVLPVLQVKAKTISCLLFVHNTSINKESGSNFGFD